MGKEILTEKQIVFLDVVARYAELTDKIYFTGGTALAAFYLNHRKSEDLDFFSDGEIEPLAVEAFLKTHKKEIGFRKFEFQKSFNRNLYFLHFKKGILKTEFTYFPFSPLEKGKKKGRLKIDSLRDIAVNKVFTISQQTRARDFVDLYFIIKRTNWKLQSLIRDAGVKFDAYLDSVQFGAQLLKAHSLKDMPKMRLQFDKKSFVSFFLSEAASLKKKILS